MKWPALLLALVATNSGAVTALVSPKYAEHITSLPTLYGVQQVQDLGAAKLIVYKPVAKKLAIPGAKGIVPFVMTLPTITLTWDYPADQITNVVFEVWFATTLVAGPPLVTYDAIPTGFTLSVTVDAPPVTIQTSLPQAFYIVRAKDRMTGVYSLWNQLASIKPVMLEIPGNSQMVSNTITLVAVVSLPLIHAPDHLTLAAQL